MITLQVENVRCGGCSSTISRRLLAVDGVRSVAVDVDTQTVTVDAPAEREAELVSTLHSLGYPLKAQMDVANGVATKLKSLVSCAVGRFDPRGRSTS